MNKDKTQQGLKMFQLSERKIPDSNQRHHASTGGNADEDSRSDTTGKPDDPGGRLQDSRHPTGMASSCRPGASLQNGHGQTRDVDKEMIKDIVSLNMPPTDSNNPDKTNKTNYPGADLPSLAENLSPWDVLPTDGPGVLQQPLVPHRLDHGLHVSQQADTRNTKGSAYTGNDGSKRKWFLGEQDFMGTTEDTRETGVEMELRVDEQKHHPVMDTTNRHTTEAQQAFTDIDNPKVNTSQGYYQRTTRPTTTSSPVENGEDMRGTETSEDAVRCRVEGCNYIGSQMNMGLCRDHLQLSRQSNPDENPFFMYRSASSYGSTSGGADAYPLPHSHDSQHGLYQEIHSKAPNMARNISFGEGVPGQGYNPNPLFSPRARDSRHQGYQYQDLYMHSASKEKHAARAHQRQSTTPEITHDEIPRGACRDRNCRNKGRSYLNGFCPYHAEEIRKFMVPNRGQAFTPGNTQPVPICASTPNAVSNDSQWEIWGPPDNYPSTPDIDSRHRHRCVTARCNRWGQHDLEKMCAQCYNSNFRDQDMSGRCDVDGGLPTISDEDLKDYESMVGNIITVSKDAKRKCKRPSCENFGNIGAHWFCNECYHRTCSTGDVSGQNSLPCHSCLKQVHDMNSSQSVASTSVGTPHTPGRSGSHLKHSMQGNPQGELRRLMSQPRFRCKKTGCNNFGNVTHQGYCNSCIGL